METKQEIRQWMKQRRRSLSAQARQDYSEQIAERVIRHSMFGECDTLYCYAAYNEEADTARILKEAWRLGKCTAVPKVVSEGQMEFYEIHSPNELTVGYHGIPEPAADTVRVCPDEGRNTLIILPGLAFDRNGNRLGYGGGFYDRYLQKYPFCHTIGIAFSAQCIEQIPSETHDCRAETVITEKGIWIPWKTDCRTTR